MHRDGVNDLLRLGKRNDHALAARSEAAEGHDQAGHVKHGQRQKVFNACVSAVVGIAGHQVGVKIQVGQHYAFGPRRGATGENDQVRRFTLDQLLNWTSLVGAKRFAEFVIQQKANLRLRRHTILKHRLQQKRFHSCLFQNVANVIRREHQIDGYQHGADARTAKERGHIFWRVGGKDRH